MILATAEVTRVSLRFTTKEAQVSVQSKFMVWVVRATIEEGVIILTVKKVVGAY